MGQSNYANYVISDYLNKEQLASRGLSWPVITPGVPSSSPLLWLDETRVPGAFYMEVLMYTPGTKSDVPTLKTQTHDVDEVLGFVGTDPQDPHDLGGEIELYLGDEKHIITRSSLVFIPRGLKHLPLTLKRVDRPIVHFAILNGGRYLFDEVDPPQQSAEPQKKGNVGKARYAKYIITDYLSKEEVGKRGLSMPVREAGRPFPNYLLWLDGIISSGAFFSEVSMIEPAPMSSIPRAKPQVHEWDEVLAFVSTDLEHAHDLGGSIELNVGDEILTLTKTCLVFIPRGVKHLPMTFKSIKKPVIFLAIGNNTQYLWKEAK